MRAKLYACIEKGLTCYKKQALMALMKTQKLKETRSGQVLAEYMGITGMTVAEVAKRTGLTRSFVYMILRGQHEVGFKSALALKAGLGISLDKWDDMKTNGDKNA